MSQRVSRFYPEWVNKGLADSTGTVPIKPGYWLLIKGVWYKLPRPPKARLLRKLRKKGQYRFVPWPILIVPVSKKISAMEEFLIVTGVTRGTITVKRQMR